jgi:hypothetical protein
MKIQFTTLAKYKPRIEDGAKLNLGISGKKQEANLTCCMSTSNSNQVLEIFHFAYKPNLRMLQQPSNPTRRPGPEPARGTHLGPGVVRSGHDSAGVRTAAVGYPWRARQGSLRLRAQ